MPPRDPALPEGTDKIIQGAAQLDGGETGGGGSGSGFVASGGGGDTGGTAVTSSGGSGGASSSGGGSGGGSSGGGAGVQRLREQVTSQVQSLKDQATEKVRGFADDGKHRATTMLDDFTDVITDAANAIEERFGAEYSGYARRAAGAVSNLSGSLRDRDLEDLLDDTRSAIRRSPGIAIGIAAIAGFALVRVLKTGIEEASGNGGGTRSPGGGTGNSGGGTGGGTTAGRTSGAGTSGGGNAALGSAGTSTGA